MNDSENHAASAKPLHQVIYDHVQDLIQSGQYQSQKLPSDGQLMRLFNASRGTVCKAMRNLEISGQVERFQGKGSFVRKTPLDFPPLFSLVIAAPGDMAFYGPFCSTLASECSRCNCGLLWGGKPGPDPRNLTKRLCHDWGQQLLAQRVTGVFFVPGEIPDDCAYNTNQLFLEEMAKIGLAVVLLDRDYVDFPEEGRFDTVSVNNFHAGFTQAEHLIQHGCQKILYFSRPGILSTKTARLAGYLYALRRARLPFQPEWIIRDTVHDSALVDKILQLGADGIACFCDEIAVNLMRLLLEQGVEIPRQIKIIGLDDVTYSRMIQIPLTSLRQPCAEISRLALNLMQERIRHPTLPPRHLQLAAELIVRDSTVGADHDG